MRAILILAVVVSLSGCGRFDRWVSGMTGDGSETCHDGVVYLQFTSGASVKYLPDGRIATCKQ